MCMEHGGLNPQNHKSQDGVSRGEWYNCPSGETSVGMYKLKEDMEKSCSDHLAIHQRKCTHGRMEIL
jgi:hypothetical protein